METNTLIASYVLDGIGRGVGEISTLFPYSAMRYVSDARHPWFSRSLRISVIVCTKDRPAGLAATVHSLYAQTAIPFELVIMDQSEAPEHARQTQDEFASPFAVRPRGMRFIYDHGGLGSSISQARNCGKLLARGDIFLFLDDDVVLEPHFIEEILTAYQDDALLDGVAGTVIDHPPPPPSRWSKLLRLFGPGPAPDSNVEQERAERRGSTSGISFRAESIQDLRFEDGVDFCKHLLQRGPARLVVDPRALLKVQPV